MVEEKKQSEYGTVPVADVWLVAHLFDLAKAVKKVHLNKTGPLGTATEVSGAMAEVCRQEPLPNVLRCR